MAEKEKKEKKVGAAKSKNEGEKKTKAGKGRKVAGPTMAVSDGKEVKHPVPRLKKLYVEKVVAALMEKHGRKNALQVPRLEKIVLNIGVSEARENAQILDTARGELAVITGQWPQLRRAHKSISNFKIREGMPLGVRVTLRGDRMYEFLDRLISTAIPRIRDFRGLERRGFDGAGNYNLGLREQLIFPEINTEETVKQRGMNISFVTTAKKDPEGVDLLSALGIPFRKVAEKKEAVAA